MRTLRKIRTSHPVRDESEVEDLLRRAAGFSPAAAPPSRFASVALERWEARRVQVRRRQRAAVVAGVFLLAAAWLLVPRAQPGVPGESLARVPEPSSAPSAAGPAGPLRKAVNVAYSSPELEAPPREREPVRRAASRRPQSAVRVARSTPRRVEPAAPARWEHETVHYQVVQVVTPGVLIQEAADGSPLAVTPGVVESYQREEAPPAACSPLPEDMLPQQEEPIPTGSLPEP